MKGRKHSTKTKRKLSLTKMGSKNPNFGKKLSKEIRKKMSDSKKGTTNAGSIKKGERKSKKTEFKKGQIPHNKGKKTEFKKGRIPHNKGQKGYTNSGSFKKGMTTWNKGKILVPLDDQRKKRNKTARKNYAKDLPKSRAKSKAWYEKNKEKEKIRGKIYTTKNKDKIKQRILDLKFEVASHYSKVISNSDVPVCACIGCGEKHIEFLELDHINGRKSMNHGPSLKAEHLCRVLRRDGYPKGIQILCSNCNHAKRDTGNCPVHQQSK